MLDFMVQENTKEPFGLLEDLELKGALNDEKKMHAFCCACCRLIWDKLPDLAKEALEIAESQVNSSIDSKEIENIRVQLWNYLGSDYMKTNIPTVAATRAVICCLYELENESDYFSVASYTMDFCNSVENKKSEQFELLSKIFTKSHNQT